MSDAYGKVSDLLLDEVGRCRMAETSHGHARGGQPWTRRFPPPPATPFDAGVVLERAYDGLHRIQAMLAYLHIVKCHVPGIAQFLDETKRTYQQALSRHQQHDFEGAREFASASASLAALVEVVISRTLRSNTTYPSIVPPPPQREDASEGSAQLEEQVQDLEGVLSRIHWLLENGTLPLEDRTQVRRLTSWSDALLSQARQMRGKGASEDASELLLAARAAADAAEHVCRRWYAGHAVLADGLSSAGPQSR